METLGVDKIRSTKTTKICFFVLNIKKVSPIKISIDRQKPNEHNQSFFIDLIPKDNKICSPINTDQNWKFRTRSEVVKIRSKKTLKISFLY